MAKTEKSKTKRAFEELLESDPTMDLPDRPVTAPIVLPRSLRGRAGHLMAVPDRPAAPAEAPLRETTTSVKQYIGRDQATLEARGHVDEESQDGYKSGSSDEIGATREFEQEINNARDEYRNIRNDFVNKLESKINSYLLNMTNYGFSCQVEAFNNVSKIISEFNVAVRCTGDDQPGKAHASNPNRKYPRGQFWIQARGSDTAADHSPKLADLLPLKLMDAPPRREALAEWHLRVKDSGNKRSQNLK